MKLKTTTQIIAVEGWPWVSALGLVALLLMLLGAFKLALFVVVVLGMVAFYFRNGERIAVESDALSLTAPIDGRVESITLQPERIALTLYNTPLDNHLIRSPLGGATFLSHRRRGGLCGLLEGKLSILGHQEQLSLGSQGPIDHLVLILQPQLAQPTLYVEPDDRLFTGQRIGFFQGGRVTLLMPKNIELRVSIGDRVSGGESPIGFLRSGQ